MPQVSVIVPIYKVENVLHNCVDSILNQTFSDFELILVDDGSPDGSDKICDDYADKDNRIVVIHKENGGVSSARNTGIDASKGKYLLFVDSDDYISSDYIETLLKAKNEYPTCDNIWCGFQTKSTYLKEEKPAKEILFDNTQDVSVKSTKSIMTLHERWLDAGPVCKLYDREKLISNNIKFPEDLSLGEDLLFNFNYLDNTNGEIAVINRCNYNYVFTNEESLGSKYYPDLFGIYQRINAKMKYYIDKWECNSEQISKYYDACFFKYEVVLKNTFSNKNTASKKEKILYNNKILHSHEFSESFNNMSYKPNVLYKIAYSSKNYRVVMMVDKLFSLLKK